MKLKTKDFLTFEELSSKELSLLLELSIKFKKDFKKGKQPALLKNKTLAMIFQSHLQELGLVLKLECSNSEATR